MIGWLKTLAGARHNKFDLKARCCHKLVIVCTEEKTFMRNTP